MKMNLKEMKTLYTFGCPNREATVERLRYVAALTPDPAAKKLFYMQSLWIATGIITWRKVMAKLTKYEKETIILFNEGEDTASIYTYNASLRKRLALFSKKHPDLCRLEKSHEQGGVTYLLDKSRLSIRLQPPYSEERRRKASENAKQNGFNSQME